LFDAAKGQLITVIHDGSERADASASRIDEQIKNIYVGEILWAACAALSRGSGFRASEAQSR